MRSPKLVCETFGEYISYDVNIPKDGQRIDLNDKSTFRTLSVPNLSLWVSSQLALLKNTLCLSKWHSMRLQVKDNFDPLVESNRFMKSLTGRHKAVFADFRQLRLYGFGMTGYRWNEIFLNFNSGLYYNADISSAFPTMKIGIMLKYVKECELFKENL